MFCRPFNVPVVSSTDRSKAVFLVLVLFYLVLLRWHFMLCLVLFLVLMFFNSDLHPDHLARERKACL